MYTYHLSQWLLFFFLYCFLGWVWESCYVSAKSHKWVNRGFLHGPMLPIYGSGAIIVLVSTLPVRGNIPLIFLFGMIGATVLEYITGALMEKLFGVRYWDYSNQFCNLNGHICLTSSLAWGVFSVLMVQYAHKPFEHLILMIPEHYAQILAFCISVVFTVDFTVSFQAALDLKELLISLRDNNEEIRRLEKRFEVVVAVVDSEREQFKEKVGQHVEQSRERLEQGREYLAQSRERLEQGREALEQEHEYLSKGRDRIGAARERLEQKLRGYTERLEELEQIYRDRYEKENGEGQTGEKLRSELDELRARISGIYRRLPERKTRRNKHIRTLLKRNPGAVSLKFPNWLEQLREENEENQQEKS